MPMKRFVSFKRILTIDENEKRGTKIHFYIVASWLRAANGRHFLSDFLEERDPTWLEIFWVPVVMALKLLKGVRLPMLLIRDWSV
jgi:hypothetical protein